MTALKSLALAFAMYSKIPMPPVEWEGKHQTYVLCAFPAVGVVVGLGELLWYHLAQWLGLNVLFAAAVAVVIPILLTGGIHLDGFCDTSDALHSHQSRERKLDILKDSHIGAFALIMAAVYLMLNLGAWGQVLMNGQAMVALALVFPLSRSLSGLWAVTLPNARGDGLLFHFANGEQVPVVRGILIGEAALCGLLMVILAPGLGMLMLLAGALSVWAYLHMARKEFGGVTGDLAGWFVQVFELTVLLASALFGRMV